MHIYALKLMPIHLSNPYAAFETLTTMKMPQLCFFHGTLDLKPVKEHFVQPEV